MKKLITILITMGLLISNPFLVKADINYRLLNEWSKQPTKVQNALVRETTSIEVVNSIPYQTYLSETWAVTNTYANGKQVVLNQILIQNEHEECLTHEVGHVLSNYNHYLYFWTDNYIWDMCYLTEANKQMIFPQGWDNKYEYFACCYEEYLRFPQYMKVVQPSSYTYMQTVFTYL